MKLEGKRNLLLWLMTLLWSLAETALILALLEENTRSAALGSLVGVLSVGFGGAGVAVFGRGFNKKMENGSANKG